MIQNLGKLEGGLQVTAINKQEDLTVQPFSD